MIRRILRALALLLALSAFTAPPAFAGTPSIEITSVPTYGVDGYLHGVVSGVDFQTHRVAVYIYIDGVGWWTKPSVSQPTVPIQNNGTFTADVATGGIDNRATIYCAALLHQSTDPPTAEGHYRIPPGLISLDMDCEERYSRTIQFAGRTWGVKEAPIPVGPGQNLFSDRTEDVYVDAEGLHLSISLRQGSWYCTEVILLENLGHGTYVFRTDSELDDLDVYATFSGFTWDAHGDEETVPNWPFREIDIEDSRWGNGGDPNNSQMVVQPFYVPGNVSRYAIPDLSADAALTRLFRWTPTHVRFLALRGDGPFIERPRLIHDFTYHHAPGQAHYVPEPGREHFRFVLWLNEVAIGGSPPPAPAGGQPIEVVVTDFDYVPL